jgi:cytochrome c oxidase subunit IV
MSENSHTDSNDHDQKHGYYTGDIHNQFVEEHVADNNVKVIWKTFWILLLITITEVGIAFTSIPHETLIVIFIVLTVVKAYYIIGFFMHLKHEQNNFGSYIIIPFILIIFLIVMILAEGTYLKLIG